MKKNFIWIYLFLILGVFLFSLPSSSIKLLPNKQNFNDQEQTITNFNITDVTVDYFLDKEGNYTSSFTIKFIANEYLLSDNISGNLKFFGHTLSNFHIFYEIEEIKFNEYKFENFTSIEFTNKISPVIGLEQKLVGFFTGSYNDKSSGIFNYEIGIDWGTQNVGKQEISLISDDRYHSPIFQVPNIPATRESLENPYLVVHKWYKAFEQNFFLNFQILLKSTSFATFLLITPQNTLNLSFGDVFFITVKNNGTIPITGYIVVEPYQLMFPNVTKFIIMPREIIVISIKTVKTNMNDTKGYLYILTEEVNEKYTLEINLIKPHSLLNLNYVILILALICLTILGIFGYKNRTRIKINFTYYINQLSTKLHEQSSSKSIIPSKTVYENITIDDWHKIESKWSNILSENELKILELLFFEDHLNQQSIAVSLGMSKMSVSRLITKLERKNLLHRETVGSNNIIRLNQMRL